MTENISEEKWFDVHFDYSVCPLSRLPTWKGRRYDPDGSQTPGCNQNVLASLLRSFHYVRLYLCWWSNAESLDRFTYPNKGRPQKKRQISRKRQTYKLLFLAWCYHDKVDGRTDGRTDGLAHFHLEGSVEKKYFCVDCVDTVCEATCFSFLAYTLTSYCD